MYKLIIADDELSIRIGLSELNWGIFGIELAAAFSNGKEAYDYILQNEADIVLTDIKMPVMDGLELAEKTNALKSGIIVIMPSSRSLPPGAKTTLFRRRLTTRASIMPSI